MKLGMVQMHVTEDKEKNLNYAMWAIEKLAKAGADLITLPEMFNCPYENSCFPIYGECSGERSWQVMAKAARDNKVFLVAGSMPEKEGTFIYNTSYIFSPEGEELTKHRKLHLFDINIEGGQRFMESDILTSGNQVTTFDTPYGRVGVCICFDIRFPELAREMTLAGAKIIIVPASFNMTTGPKHWEMMFRQRAVDNQVFTVGVASARDETMSYVSYGNSIVASPWGDIVYQAGEKEAIELVTIDLIMVEEVREQLPLLKARRTDIYTSKT